MSEKNCSEKVTQRLQNGSLKLKRNDVKFMNESIVMKWVKTFGMTLKVWDVNKEFVMNLWKEEIERVKVENVENLGLKMSEIFEKIQ